MKINKTIANICLIAILFQGLLFSATLSYNETRSLMNPQALNITIDTLRVAQSNLGKVSVPLKVTSFKNIGAISIKIQYDSTKLRFTGITNSTYTSKFNVNNTGNVIIIGWYDASNNSPLTVTDGKLLDLNFDYSGGKANIDFILNQCEIADALGNVLNANFINGAVITTTSSVNEDGSKLNGYSLEQNYPNPFNPVTHIGYSTLRESKVRLTVFDLEGKEVALLVDKVQPAGNYNVEFDASKMPSGTYIYKLEVGPHSYSRKMTLLK